MGMFDYIEYEGKVYQTKDLDCLLDALKITEEGLLKQDGEVVPFYGDIRFYSTKDDETNTGWVEYVASFTDGKLTKIERTIDRQGDENEH